MAASVIVDTGPLVALLDSSEAKHAWAREQFARLRPPLLTCESVLSEAAFLLQRGGLDSSVVPMFVARGVLMLMPIETEATAVAGLMKKYALVPMSFADACLVRLVELTPHARLLTLDSDFQIYKQGGRRTISTIAP